MVDKLAMFDVALEAARPDQRQRLIGEFTRVTESRLRFYDTSARKNDDSFAHAPPTRTLPDPDLQPWNRDVARAMDRGIDGTVAAPATPTLTQPANHTQRPFPPDMAPPDTRRERTP